MLSGRSAAAASPRYSRAGAGLPMSVAALRTCGFVSVV